MLLKALSELDIIDREAIVPVLALAHKKDWHALFITCRTSQQVTDLQKKLGIYTLNTREGLKDLVGADAALLHGNFWSNKTKDEVLRAAKLSLIWTWERDQVWELW